jgi:rod shape determining protein RodA
MEKGALKKWFGQFFFGFDRQLGLIFLALATIGFITFLSAGQNTAVRIEDEIRNFVLAFILMWLVSRIPPKWLEVAAVWVYSVGLALLIAVALFGLIKKGARRWLNLGFVIQPSEIMKIAMPLMLAGYLKLGIMRLLGFYWPYPFF